MIIITTIKGSSGELFNSMFSSHSKGCHREEKVSESNDQLEHLQILPLVLDNNGEILPQFTGSFIEDVRISIGSFK